MGPDETLRQTLSHFTLRSTNYCLTIEWLDDELSRQISTFVKGSVGLSSDLALLCLNSLLIVC